MGGAGTAAPLDANGALHWNPGLISALPQSRADIGVDVIFNRNEVSSTVPIGPGVFLSGTTHSDPGVWALPAIGIVYKPVDSRFTYGVGMNAIGGFITNYPADPTNPIFAPPVLGGFGHSYSRLGIVQFAPTISYQVTDNLSFGFAPTIDIADVQAAPFAFDTPNPPGIYPGGMGTRSFWGGGMQAGLFYDSPGALDLGFSIKSPQWFERAEINTSDAVGGPRVVTTQFEYPMILSWGAAYNGIDNLVVAADVRYIDFDSTELFGESPKFTAQPAGPALRGLGWQSVWVLAIGAQYQLSERVSVRGGYSYNENPIPDQYASVNFLAPATYQHVISLGTSMQMTQSLVCSLTWVHAFESTVSGPFITPGGAIPLSKVAVTNEINALVLGMSVLF
jgi:long-chain fatty acid transport protein